MHPPEPTSAGAALTDFILGMFRASNQTLAWGDRIVAPLGLTSARWQILGAIVAAQRPQPVAWLARDLEANRQNVQRIVNDLAREGLVTFEPNPHHRRAQLVTLTDKGTTAFNQAIGLYTPLVNELSAGLEEEEIRTALRVVTELRKRLAGPPDTEE
ncbi:MarR family winged helix-turn-helix transcriptional regulator [Pseudomonas chlororaphis]|uniref:MarR family transcriptional regulator n=1 Tax=Pseudomonas chlororaphis TaxID=587753 RepID=A0A0D5Y1F3_9PSED|nr:MarR family winged helix-turn-helix transcriptional regulator [Pseudomonas chlororaphis]AKA24832.1 MarR family transcriptional regulator [Pseudomonas chlororaphis]